MASYPGSIPTITPMGPLLSSAPHSAVHTQLKDELEAIAASLGPDPQIAGSVDYGTVNDRLDAECIKITTSLDAPSPISGRIRMDTDTGRLRWWNGTVWASLAGPPLTVSSSNDRVGINVPSPGAPLSVRKVDAGDEPNVGPFEVGRFTNTAAVLDDCVVTIIADRQGSSHLRFGDQDDNNTGGFNYSHAAEEMLAVVGNQLFQRWTTSGVAVENAPFSVDRTTGGDPITYQASDIVRIKSTASAGAQTFLSLGAGVDGVAGIRFADTDADAGSIRYEHSTDSLHITTGMSESIVVFSDGLTRIQRGGGAEPPFLVNEAFRVRKNTTVTDSCVVTCISGASGRARYNMGHGTNAAEAILDWENASNTFRVYTNGQAETGLEINRAGNASLGTGASKLLVNPNGGIGAVGISTFLGGAVVLGTGAKTLEVLNDGGVRAQQIYDGTTAGAANVNVVQVDGLLRRSTSAAKYKTNIQPVDVARCWDVVEACPPVTFRHEDGGDYLGLIADTVAAVEPLAGVFDTATGEVENYDHRSVLAAVTGALADVGARLAALESA